MSFCSVGADGPNGCAAAAQGFTAHLERIEDVIEPRARPNAKAWKKF
jgi:hypothetical protein